MCPTKDCLGRFATKSCEPELVSKLDDDEQNKPENFPPTARYEHITRNGVNQLLFKVVKRAVELAKMEKNKVCCDCKNCFTNDNCKCRKAALAMEREFGSKPILRNTPVELSGDAHEEFDNNFRFVCGGDCKCNKSCKLRALDRINDCFLKRFKVERHIKEMGFCLIAKIPIKQGIPVIEFTGEFCCYELAGRKDHRRYCLNLIDEHGTGFKLGKFIEGMDFIDPKFKKTLVESYKVQTFITPLHKGNIARFISHSCDPNVQHTRIFEGGLSPANLRCIFIANRDIAAGEEITFNYGEQYKKEAFNRNCLCKKCVAERALKLSQRSAAPKKIRKRTQSTPQTPSKRSSLRPCSEAEEKKKIGELMQIELPTGRLTRSRLTTIQSSTRRTRNSARVAASGAPAISSPQQTNTASVRRVAARRSPLQQTSAPTSSDASAVAVSSRQTRSSTARADVPNLSHSPNDKSTSAACSQFNNQGYVEMRISSCLIQLYATSIHRIYTVSSISFRTCTFLYQLSNVSSLSPKISTHISSSMTLSFPKNVFHFFFILIIVCFLIFQSPLSLCIQQFPFLNLSFSPFL